MKEKKYNSSVKGFINFRDPVLTLEYLEGMKEFFDELKKKPFYQCRVLYFKKVEEEKPEILAKFPF
ncbi:hypothetical protein ACFL35_05160 [Candidatus Riflebacteria bacterium]